MQQDQKYNRDVWGCGRATMASLVFHVPHGYIAIASGGSHSRAVNLKVNILLSPNIV